MEDIVKVLVDGDIVLNKACFSTEVSRKDEATGETLWESLGLGLAKYTVDKIISDIKKHTKCEDIQVFVGNSGETFRHRVAVTAPYKGNRAGVRRPIESKNIKEYLIKKYNAQSPVDMEVDDLLGLGYKDGYCIASIDKDLLQIPGLHYNLDTRIITRATELGGLTLISKKNNKKKLTGHGYKWFCAQMLLGDLTDNIIKPKAGLGDVAVYKMLKDVDTKEEMWYTINKVYTEVGRDIEENARLLWILRSDKPDEWKVI